MGKSKKDKITKAVRPNPISRVSLGEEIISDMVLDPLDTKIKSKAKYQKDGDDPEFVDEKTTQRILKQARRQQQHLEDEISEQEISSGASGGRSKAIKPQVSLGNLGSDSNESDDEGEFDILPNSAAGDYEEVEVNPEDEKALELFMNKNAGPSRTLGDLIMEKFTEKQTELQSQFSDAGGLTVQKLDPRVEKMFEGVKEILTRYRSGKLPKAFKLIPRLTNWEQILHITDPAGWSAAAMYQATRIFTSNLKEKMAQRFFNLVLLPRVRDDIVQYKKLNFHLYQALRKALFKPGAFMKGFLLPLCESGTCTLREAVIVGSVLAKNSIPLLHSSAAMLKIAEMDYSGANSIFIKIFLDKKYALPYRVIDAVVYHFLKFERDKRELPVLWHQCFLVFIQRYKDHLSSEQKEALHALLRVHPHYQITAEIRRELMTSKCRDDDAEEPQLPSTTSVVGDDDYRME